MSDFYTNGYTHKPRGQRLIKREAKTATVSNINKRTNSGPRAISASTRARIINDHPYSKQRPEFAQTLIDDHKITLNHAIDALNELAGIEDKPAMSRFEKLNRRLDKDFGQAESSTPQAHSKAKATVTQLSNTGKMTRFQRQQERLNKLYGPVGGGDAA